MCLNYILLVQIKSCNSDTNEEIINCYHMTFVVSNVLWPCKRGGGGAILELNAEGVITFTKRQPNGKSRQLLAYIVYELVLSSQALSNRNCEGNVFLGKLLTKTLIVANYLVGGRCSVTPM